mmetsp:Transcript_107557/g.213634  ORF Transcript_107557/g.213634 Transcript_107557/m.213634 type:complete len:302 (-) Transcript_107557:219-1124(-)
MSFVHQCQLCLAAVNAWVILVGAESTMPAQFLNPRHHGGSQFPQLDAAATRPPLQEKAGCCEAETADCIACSKGIKKEDLCKTNSRLPGCSRDLNNLQHRRCCEAMTAECIACRRGIGQKQVCEEDAHISGCPQLASHAQHRRSCCDALNAKCVACRMGISRRELCQQNVRLPGCSSFLHSDPKPKLCCKALTAQCISCNRGIDTKLFCEEAPQTPGCKKQVHDGGMPEANGLKRAHLVQNPWLLALHVTTLAAVCGGLAMAIVCCIQLQRAQQARVPLLPVTAQLGEPSEEMAAVPEAAS